MSEQTVEATRAELQELRDRMVNRLIDSICTLEAGLYAVRKDTPDFPLLLERVEYAVYVLRTEVVTLMNE